MSSRPPSGVAKVKRRRRGDKRHHHTMLCLLKCGGRKNLSLPYDLLEVMGLPSFIIGSKLTRSSARWCWGRSTTAYTMLELRSLIWGFDKSCMIVYCITSQPANLFSNVPYWHFRRPLAEMLKVDFSTPSSFWGFRWSGMDPYDSSPIGYY